MNEEKQIITFEEIYKGEKKPSRKPEPQDKRGYIYGLLFYAVVMYVVATIIMLVMYQMPQFTKQFSEEERIIAQVANNTYTMSVVYKDVWDTYEEAYKDSVEMIGSYQVNYVVIVNKANTLVKYALFYVDPPTGEYYFDYRKLENVISSEPSVTHWSSSHPITLVKTNVASKITYDIQAESILIEGSIVEFKPEASSLVNFLIYLILVPGIFFFMKADIKLDWEETKKIKKELFIPILVGYAYVWIGNIISTYLSTYLSGVFRLEIGEAANQQAIISAVTSSTGILMIISAVLIGPIIEELVFRKAAFGLIKNNTVALIVSSLVFGLIHVVGEASIQEALVNGLSYFVMGFVFGFIYLKANRNVMIPIIVHIINNAVSIIAILILLT